MVPRDEMAPVSPLVTLAVLVCSFFTCLLMNDFVKVLLVARFLAKLEAA